MDDVKTIIVNNLKFLLGVVGYTLALTCAMTALVALCFYFDTFTHLSQLYAELEFPLRWMR